MVCSLTHTAVSLPRRLLALIPLARCPPHHLPDEIVDPLFNLKLILVEIETIDHRACLPMPDFPPVAGLRPFFG
jgi:hypothetical protein